MRISSLRIKNFRGYSEEVTIDFNNLTVFVGKNDSGKSTILEALDIFFNEGKGAVKIDKDDVNISCQENGDNETIISVVFDDLPDKIMLDSDVETTLEKEYLLNSQGKLEISKKYKNGGSQKVWIKAYHPTNENCSDLLLKKNSELKRIINDNEIGCSNLSTNSIMRQSIWNYYKENLGLDNVEIDASKADAKQIWEKLYFYLPIYTLFQSDRANTDGDPEVKDPLQKAVNIILKEPQIQEILNEVSEQVQSKLKEVSNRTLEKLREVDKDVADELNPVIPTADKLKWNSVFNSVSISGDNDIPINKRGSGVKRLVLLSFFRGEAERIVEEGSGRGIIYAIEEPETSQHTNNQKTLVDSFKTMSSQSGVQVLLTTHSADMVKQLEFSNIRIIGDNKQSQKIMCVDNATLNYPSLNEVNFLAFKEISEEYHNELYALIEFHNFKDEYFSDKETMTYIRIQRNGKLKEEQKCLTEYIRHQIHHPENKKNIRYTSVQLSESIDLMRRFIKEKVNSEELMELSI